MFVIQISFIGRNTAYYTIKSGGAPTDTLYFSVLRRPILPCWISPLWCLFLLAPPHHAKGWSRKAISREDISIPFRLLSRVSVVPHRQGSHQAVSRIQNNSHSCPSHAKVSLKALPSRRYPQRFSLPCEQHRQGMSMDWQPKS